MSNRQPALRPIIIYTIYIILFAVIQVTALRDVRILGERPDLTLVLAILTGYLFGIGDGLAIGLAVGFLRDMLAGRTIGLGMLILMYAAMLSHVLLRDFFRRKTWMGLIQVLLVTVIYEVLLMFLSWFFPMLPDQVPQLGQLFAHLIVRLPIQGLLNVAVAVPMIWLLRYHGPYDPRVLREDLDDGSTGEGKWRTI
ncbi:MAG: hypothetical protein PHC86_02595 [Eubacteriales bacterium]|nr:hypothetical protein [Eubacteriales bacterium]